MRRLGAVAHLTVLLLAAAISASGAPFQWPEGGPDMAIDATTKAQVILSLVSELRRAYVFPDVGDKVADTVEKSQRAGAFNSITSAKGLRDALNREMADVAHDLHLHVLYSSEVLPPDPPPGQTAPPLDPQTLSELGKANYDFEDARRLEGNIGYLKMTGFMGAGIGGPTLAAAMEFLSRTDALIIDLRDNSGGYPSMVALLASYFFRSGIPVHLNDLESRNRGTKEYTLTQWWVFPYVPGPRYVDREVYILTSHETPSAAEEFCYDLQTQKRATVVGETTWGGANPGDVIRLGDHFQVFMPTGHAINPITKTNWEGVGVKPDIEIPQQEALKAAQKAALEHLIAKSSNAKDSDLLRQDLAHLNSTAP